MSTIFFLTHPEVVIDPAVPVPRWPLSGQGRRRAARFVDEALVGAKIATVWSSDEQKALDGGDIIAERLGVPHRTDPELGENDRSSTGYVAPPEFWQIVAEFFAKPDQSVRGWATARDEQARIVRALIRLDEQEPADADIVVVSHGGVGQLLTAHLQGVGIGLEDKPQHPGGGCWLEIERGSLEIVAGWRSVSD